VLFGGPILSLLYGDYYRAAAWPLASLAIGQICLAAAGSAHCALLMTGQQLKALWVNALAALALIFAGSWAARHFGIAGLAAVSALVVSIESCVLTLLARRLLGVWTHVDPRLDWSGTLGRAFGQRPGAQSAVTVQQNPERCSG
jgi:O-antigen/teichoic acid export membrane protein